MYIVHCTSVHLEIILLLSHKTHAVFIPVVKLKVSVKETHLKYQVFLVLLKELLDVRKILRDLIIPK